MTKRETAEGKVAQTILQEPKTVQVGGKTYQVAPPSMATLIKVSELVSQMPRIDAQTEDIVGETLRTAKDCGVVADILATFILGAKRIRDFKPGAWGRKKSEFDQLRESLMFEKTPKELSGMLSEIIVNRMDIGFFLGISTSLSAVNMTKPTKTTASGRP